MERGEILTYLIIILLLGGFLIFFYFAQGKITGFSVFESKVKQPGSGGKDSYIQQNFANSNFGASTFIEIGRESSKFSRGLIEFDLSDVPTNARIKSATLQLYMTVNSNDTFVVEVRRLNSSWTELNVTWDSRNETNNWTITGGDFDLTIYDNISVDNTIGWKTWNVTNLVQEWVNGTYSNYGILLKTKTANVATFKTFASSDNTDLAIWPKLNINYTIPLNVTFVAPTSANGSTLNQKDFFINVTLINGNASEAKLEWAGTNYTMNNGSATPSTNWFLNLIGLTNGVYTYKVYANDSDTNLFDVSETRTVNILFSEIQQQSSGGGSGGLSKTKTLCQENWECALWTECDLNTNTKTRICNDKNECKTENEKPIETMSCLVSDKTEPSESLKKEKEASKTTTQDGTSGLKRKGITGFLLSQLNTKNLKLFIPILLVLIILIILKKWYGIKKLTKKKKFLKKK